MIVSVLTSVVFIIVIINKMLGKLPFRKTSSRLGSRKKFVEGFHLPFSCKWEVSLGSIGNRIVIDR